MNFRQMIFLVFSFASPLQAEPLLLRPETHRSTITVSGRISPFLVSAVSAESAGVIEKRLFELSDTVTAGAEVFLIESEELKRNKSRTEQKLQQTRLDKAFFQSRLIRRQENINAYSEEEVEQEKLVVEKTALEILTLQSNIESLNDELRRRTLKAPFKGRIAALYKERGEWVSPGEPVFQIYSHGDWKIRVNIPVKSVMQKEAELKEIEVLIGEKRKKAVFFRMVPEVEPVNQMLTAEFRFSEDTEISLWGQILSAEIPVTTIRISAPESYVKRSLGLLQVKLQKPEGPITVEVDGFFNDQKFIFSNLEKWQNQTILPWEPVGE